MPGIVIGPVAGALNYVFLGELLSFLKFFAAIEALVAAAMIASHAFLKYIFRPEAPPVFGNRAVVLPTTELGLVDVRHPIAARLGMAAMVLCLACVSLRFPAHVLILPYFIWIGAGIGIPLNAILAIRASRFRIRADDSGLRIWAGLLPETRIPWGDLMIIEGDVMDEGESPEQHLRYIVMCACSRGKGFRAISHMPGFNRLRSVLESRVPASNWINKLAAIAPALPGPGPMLGKEVLSCSVTENPSAT